MKENICALIMAGGVGTRFWPESREALPKQFLDIAGEDQSLLQLTFKRLLPLVDSKNIYIATNQKYASLVLQQLPDLSQYNLILEPSRNNTAPCIAYGAFKMAGKNPNSIMIVLPSDHHIKDESLFRDSLMTCAEFSSRNDALLTLGVLPTRPDTGYGYIELAHNPGEIKPVKSFKEKPGEELAQSYLEQGNYVWNAGIFVWSTKSILSALSKHAPSVYTVLNEGANKFNTPEESDFIAEAYPRTQSISIDYAVMESAQNIYCLPADFGWTDLGTWNSLYDFRKTPDQVNVNDIENSIIIDSKSNYLRAPDGKLVVIKGLEDYIVVDTEDVLMIYPKNSEQEIKAIRDKVEKHFSGKYS